MRPGLLELSTARAPVIPNIRHRFRPCRGSAILAVDKGTAALQSRIAFAYVARCDLATDDGRLPGSKQKRRMQPWRAGNNPRDKWQPLN